MRPFLRGPLLLSESSFFTISVHLHEAHLTRPSPDSQSSFFTISVHPTRPSSRGPLLLLESLLVTISVYYPEALLTKPSSDSSFLTISVHPYEAFLTRSSSTLGDSILYYKLTFLYFELTSLRGPPHEALSRLSESPFFTISSKPHEARPTRPSPYSWSLHSLL